MSGAGRKRWVVVAAVGVVVVAGAAGWYFFTRTQGSPRQTASAYLRDWQRGDYAAMDSQTAGKPAGGLAAPLREAATDLGARHMRLTLGKVSQGGNETVARYTAAVSLASGQTWTYRGRLNLVQRGGGWRVAWSPADIYPSLRAGERFTLKAVWPARAPVLAADGTVISSQAAIAQSGSLQLVTGLVVPATAAQAKVLGAPYQAGDLIGEGGVEQQFQSRLAGKPSLDIQITGPGPKVDITAAKFGGSPGQSVRTTLVMRDQLAASAAVRAAHTSKNVDVVALQPSTGNVLAVVEDPGGFNRPLEGLYPPGSTFKVVTASALVNTGERPSSTVQCPSSVTLGGTKFHNFDFEKLGTTSLQTAFAVSCNTTFAMLATQRLSGASLAAMALAYGFNSQPSLGIPATMGKFEAPAQTNELAADAFGQGTDLVSPLSQATLAAAVEDGTWRPARLVTTPAVTPRARPRVVSPAILASLRPMMRAVVTAGTASHVGLPPGVFGKTGTAEFGSGPNPPSHAWFIGYRGDLAFSVLVERGGVGADASGPIANAFVRRA